MLNKSTLGVAIAAALSFSVSAEQSIERLTVTANKFEQSITDVLASVTVIERSDIETSNVRDLPSLLATQVGFQINSNGGFGQSSGVSLRGSSSRHTLILIDGVRTGSATLGYKSISNIPLNSIERIEIVKGSRAAVYGSDALAGVINIITRTKESVSLDATFGTDAYQNYQVAGTTVVDAVKASFNAGFEKTDGFDVLQGVAPDEDGYENKNLGFNIRYADELLGELKALGQYSEGNAQYDNAFSPIDSIVENNEFENYQLGLGWDKSFTDHKHSINVAIATDDSDNKGYDYTGAIVTNSYKTKRKQFDYHGSYNASQFLTVNGGLNWYKDEIYTNGKAYLADSKVAKAAFLGGYFDDNKVIANLALRLDDDEQFGNETTYAAAVGYHLNKRATLRLSQSTGFKAPTFNDLYFPDPLSPGNPNLAPETSTNQELGLSLDFSQAKLDISIFRNNIENLIAWAPNAAGKWQPENINEARHEGVEFSFANKVLGFDNQFNFTYLNAENTETGVAQTYVSPRTVNWFVAKQWGDFDAGFDMQYRSDRQGKVTELSSYTLWNLTANYQFNSALSFSARVENLFDKQYNAVDSSMDYATGEVFYYNTVDRRFFVGASYQF
ncbi:TonB-dependent receptor [Pseudoalteromonas sp. SR44-5]|uniref:TonB-dependent receptor domain-containing protein n=1 Tax=unclassified Pseudoalteromonas TaxID=194690 RepID=UPI00160229B8|nr:MULTISPECIES: TonB-dependent receptor [unclassified Pseudoalteromonas]MBB1341801.1 TonB-dependent receptor [Pseudoalteromonas sp. SR45-6]MBB1367017.1 TonB-dependent receptor [Pseudoalteromonas sp. SR44-5]MBB1467608.1 TonB-dependent receptor [Pseudoalteromonas sp. SG41-5]